jgi:pimeloyl-ACP methyl ester carboxylesterase
MFNHLPKHLSVIAKQKYAHCQQFPVSKDWEKQAEELIDFIRNNASEPVYGVGHSFGGVISYMAACKRPDLFKGLIMLEPPLITGITSKLLKVVRYTPLIHKFNPARQARTRCTTWPIDTDLVAYFSKKSLFKNMHMQCIEDYVSSAIKVEDQKYKLNFSHDVEADIFSNVPMNIHRFYGKLTVPGLLVTAQDSHVCRPALVAPFVKQNKIEQQVALDCGHMFPLEKPQWTANLISEQIDKWETAKVSNC